MILLATFLAGCANSLLWGPPVTPEEMVAIEKAQTEAEAREQENRAKTIIAKYAPFCNQFGFKEQTPGFAHCVLSLHREDQAKEAARRARISNAFRNMGDSFRRNRPTQTDCQQIGNSISCTTR